MMTYSSILAWEIPRTEEPSGLQSMGSQRVGHTFMSCPIHWESNVEQNTKSILSSSLKVNSDMCSVEITTVPSNSPKISRRDICVMQLCKSQQITSVSLVSRRSPPTLTSV